MGFVKDNVGDDTKAGDTTGTDLPGNKRGGDVNVGGISSGVVIPTQEIVEAAISDKVSSSLKYYGWAAPATLTSQALWQITEESISGGVKRYKWAKAVGSTAAFYDNVWDDRAGLVYI